MRYLLDTGILARALHRSDPQHQIIREALRKIARDRHTFVTATQNIAEFWNLCTRPATARGGFGLSIEQTTHRLRILERLITVLREPQSAYRKWKSLVVDPWRDRQAGARCEAGGTHVGVSTEKDSNP